MQTQQHSRRTSNTGQPSLSGDGLQSSIDMLTPVRALNLTNCEELRRALDLLLRLVTAVQKARIGSPDSGNLAAAVSRLHRKLLHEISVSGNGVEVRFAPAVMNSVTQLSSQITNAAEEAYPKAEVTRRRSLDPNGPEIAARGLNKAMDDFEKVNLKINVVTTRATTAVSATTREPNPVQPSAQDSVAQLPKSRILVLGKSGTGKSTLINRMFNGDPAKVSCYISGVSNIDDEITSPGNSRFIFHDSQGFESGEGRNMEVLKTFLQLRKTMKTRDQVHAVWLCVQCPSSNDRVIEKGDEYFLGEDFGLPVILVYTKYDLLQDAMECEIREENDCDDSDDKIIAAEGSKLAEVEYQKSCIKPLSMVIGAKLQHTTRISVHNSESIDTLVALTRRLIDERFGQTVSPHLGSGAQERRSRDRRPEDRRVS